MPMLVKVTIHNCRCARDHNRRFKIPAQLVTSGSAHFLKMITRRPSKSHYIFNDMHHSVLFTTAYSATIYCTCFKQWDPGVCLAATMFADRHYLSAFDTTLHNQHIVHFEEKMRKKQAPFCSLIWAICCTLIALIVHLLKVKSGNLPCSLRCTSFSISSERKTERAEPF